MSAETADLTALLWRWRDGDREAFGELVERVYPMLRKIASRRLRGGKLELQTTELVHDGYLRLLEQDRTAWQDRRHFYKIAATVMRRVVVDHARAAASHKRGGRAQRIRIDEALDAELRVEPDWLELDSCLDQLERLDADARRLVELRFFVGLSLEEAAATLGIGRTTAVRRWRFARAWLREHWPGQRPAEA